MRPAQAKHGGGRHVICFGATDKGPYRENNEDYFAFAEAGDYTLMAVADGLGGESSGEIASCLAADEALSYLSLALPSAAGSEIPDLIGKAFNKANVAVLLNALENKDREGMCTTLTIAVIKGTEVTIGHIGDTRCYMMHGSSVMKLTVDHNEAAMLASKGEIKEDEATSHPGRNRLYKVVGLNQFLNPDIYSYNIIYGDLIILCSDGFYSQFTDNQIAGLIRNDKSDLELLARKLVSEAIRSGSRDNITVLIGNTSRK